MNMSSVADGYGQLYLRLGTFVTAALTTKGLSNVLVLGLFSGAKSRLK